MEKQNLVIVLLVLLIALVGLNAVFGLSGITPSGQSKLPINIPPDGGGGSDIINANACNADETCEITGRIQTPGTMWLTSEAGAAKIEADLTLTKIGQGGGTVFKTNDAGSLTITPQSGAAKVEGSLTVTENLLLGTNPINYIDALDCNYDQDNEVQGIYSVFRCEIGEVIVQTGFVQCSLFESVPRLVGIEFNPPSIPSLAIAHYYTCVNTQTGNWTAPEFTSGSCCKLKTTGSADQNVSIEKKIVTIDKAGKITTTTS